MKKLFNGVYIESFMSITLIKPYFSCGSPGKGEWKVEIVLDCGVSTFSDKGFSCRSNCIDAIDKLVVAVDAEVAKEMAEEQK
jgi:hypothetical protein